MNIKNTVAGLTRVAGKNALQFKKNSPHIMFAAGVVGVVGTVVLASRATLRVEAILDEHEDVCDKIDNTLLERPEIYSPADARNDRLKNMTSTAIKMTKLYGPAVLVGAASIGCLTGAHVTLSKRNAGLMAAYTVVDKALKEYRERVVADQGEDKDREYMYGTTEKEVYSEKKNGEPKVDRVKVAGGTSQYAKFFGPENPNWEPTPDHNLFFLKAGQTYLNHLLQTRGHVTLNDAYDQLGMPRTSAGMVVGWIYDRDLKGEGDNYISFGIWDDENMDRFHDFMVGRESQILVEFNVDGPIHGKI